MRFPKIERSVLVPQIGKLVTDLLLLLTEAYYSKKKLLQLQKANLMLEQTRLLMRLCKDRKLISISQYEYAVKELVEIGKQLGGWIQHQRGVES